MGLVYSRSKPDIIFEKENQLINDDYVEVKKFEKPILFLNDYMLNIHSDNNYYKKKITIKDGYNNNYDVDLLGKYQKKLLDHVSGI